MGGEVKSMRMAGALVFVGILAAGCGPTHGGPPVTADYKLYEAVSSNKSPLVSVIDTRSHASERSLPLGVPSGDWKHLYSIVGGSLVDTDPQTGTTLNTMQLTGVFQLPPATITGVPGGTSPDGRWLVVESYDGSPNSVPTATHMLLINTATSKVTDRVNLVGYFHFDAVSNDGLRLYLIQYLNGKEYYVRLYNINGATGIVAEVDTSNQFSPQIVRTAKIGTGSSASIGATTAVISPDGKTLVTAGSSGIVWLDTASLKVRMQALGEWHIWSLGLSPDGSMLYAVSDKGSIA